MQLNWKRIIVQRKGRAYLRPSGADTGTKSTENDISWEWPDNTAGRRKDVNIQLMILVLHMYQQVNPVKKMTRTRESIAVRKTGMYIDDVIQDSGVTLLLDTAAAVTTFSDSMQLFAM